jgi:hypothetical protein
VAAGETSKGRQVINPEEHVLRHHHAKVLRPEDAVPAADGKPVQPTIYRYDTLTVFSKDWADDFDMFVETTLRRIGLAVVPPAPMYELPDDAPLRIAEEHLPLGIPRRLTLQPSRERPPVAPVDAWRALQYLRYEAGREEVLHRDPTFHERAERMSLEHVLQSMTAPAGARVVGHPGSEGHGDGDSDGYDGTGRAAVHLLMPTPPRSHGRMLARRPVVAIVDTHIGQHPWLPASAPPFDVVETLTISSGNVPSTIPAYDAAGRSVAPLVGRLDSHAGHGTFLAGLVRQIAPDANILAIPIMHSDGYAYKIDLTDALYTILGRVLSGRADQFVDVVVLALGYYAETPNPALNLALELAVQHVAEAGIAIVAAAGNDATSRECYPAAFSMAKWASPPGVTPVPVTAVGALNPNGTRAIFSNQALISPDWVTAWAPGVALVSTFPTTFAGSRSAVLRNDRFGKPGREWYDIDDFSTGFGLWSGTSFAAGVFAARLARDLCDPEHERELAKVDRGSASQRMGKLIGCQP